MKTAALFLLAFILHPSAFILLAAEQPNILWITAEDMSPTLGCYGDTYATTPNIDKLATEGVRYTNVFATAPVCSPSRSCIINGLPATSQGTQQMRSAFPIPDYMTGFPSVLRKAGRYTSNNVKTDYNSGNYAEIIGASWNESSDTAHWRKRSDGQSFFSIFNLMTSHQSRTMVWPYEQFVSDVQSKLTPDEIHDAATVPLPPYYPDTPVIRKTQARLHDCVTAMDKEVGAILPLNPLQPSLSFVARSAKREERRAGGCDERMGCLRLSGTSPPVRGPERPLRASRRQAQTRMRTGSRGAGGDRSRRQIPQRPRVRQLL